MVLEEAALYASSASGSGRGNHFKDLVWRLADGTPKGRCNQPAQLKRRFIYVMSSNQSLAEILRGGHAAENYAAADRLITLQIDPSRPHGIFDHLPKQYASGAQFAEALKSAIAENYGLAFPFFVSQLAAE